MTEIILILIVALMGASVVLPFTDAYRRWKKEMESDEDVQDR